MWVKASHLVANRADQALRIARCAHQQRRVTVVIAHHRKVDEGLRVFADAPIFAVFYDANDFPEGAVRASLAQAFADSALSRPEAARQALVDDDDARLLIIVLRREIAALRKGKAISLRITCPNSGFLNIRLIGATREGLSLSVNEAAVAVQIQWQDGGERG